VEVCGDNHTQVPYSALVMTDFFAGCVGGAAGVFVGHPFDTVKVRLQTQGQNGIRYTGVINCFVNVIKQESFLGLYKGLASPLYGMSFQNAMLFGVHRTMMKVFEKEGLWNEFIIGCASGAVQTCLSAPIDLAKTQLQVQGKGKMLVKSQKTYQGPFDFMRKVYQLEGFKGVFRGYWVTFIRDTPGYGIYFLSYAYFCQTLAGSESVNNLGPISLMFAGGLSGMVSWTCTYPCDMVKSRLQSEPLTKSGKYMNMFDCARMIYKEGGYRIFFTGLSATIVRAFPVNAAIFSTVTLVTRALEKESSMRYVKEIL